MSARYLCLDRNYFIGIAVLFLLQLTTGGTSTTTSSPDTTNRNSTNSRQTPSYNGSPSNNDTSYSSSTTSPATPYSSPNTTNNNSDSGMTTSPDTPYISLTTNNNTSGSSKTTSPSNPYSSPTTTNNNSDSGMTTSPATPYSSLTTNNNTSGSSKTTSPATPYSSPPKAKNTSGSSMTISHPASPYSSPTTNNNKSGSSMTTSPATPYSSPTTNNNTSDSGMTTSPATPYSSPTTDNNTSGSSMTTGPAIPYSSSTTNNNTSDSGMTTSPATPYSSPTTNNNTSDSGMTTSPATPYSSPTTNNNTSDSSMTTSHAIPDSSLTTTNNKSDSGVTTSPPTPYSSPTTSNSTFDSSMTTSPATSYSSPTTGNSTSDSGMTTSPVTPDRNLTTTNNNSDSSMTTGPPTPYSSHTTTYNTSDSGLTTSPVTPYSSLTTTNNNSDSSMTISSATTYNSNTTSIAVSATAAPGPNTTFSSSTKFQTVSVNTTTTSPNSKSSSMITSPVHITNSMTTNTTSITDTSYSSMLKSQFTSVSNTITSSGTSFSSTTSDPVTSYISTTASTPTSDYNPTTNPVTLYNISTSPITVYTSETSNQISTDNSARTLPSSTTINTGTSDATTIDCGHPLNISNCVLFYTHTTFGAVVAYTCDIGYKLIGNNWNTCDESGTWNEDIPKCQIMECPQPRNIINGNIYYTYTTFGAMVTYTCEIGYRLIGNNTNTCDESGSWVGDIPACQIVDCGYPRNIKNGTLSFTKTTVGATVTYLCDIGYRLIGNNTNTCDEIGSWVGDIPECQIVDCGHPITIKNGMVNYTSTIFNAIAAYTCDIGYELIGDDITTCDENGAWIGDIIPECQIIDCGFPRNITNGRYTLIGETTYSSVAIYKCVGGFKLNNTNDRTLCKANGTWHGELGTCVRVDCKGPLPPINGMVSYSGDNMTATFSCNSGFRFIGRDKLFCLPTGNWSNNVPKCEKVEAETKYCQTEKDSRGTLWNKTSQEQIVTSLCPKGQEGSISRQCNEDGEWKLPRYTCVKKEISEAESKIDFIESSNDTEAFKTGIVSDVLHTLNTTTTTTTASSSVSPGMGDGEIEKVTSILEKVASISQGINVNEKQSEDFIGTTSNLLNPQNSGSFRSLEENKDQDGKSAAGADRVLQVVGNFTRAIANSLDQFNGSKTITTDNMVVTVAKIEVGEDIQFPLKSSTSADLKSSTSAEIPHSALADIGTYSGILYHNLSGLLSPRIHDKGSVDEGDFEINAAVLDMQLLNTSGTPPNFKINLNFDNFQNGKFESKCCFWNYNRSSWDTFGCRLDTDKTNNSLTVCTCNHTTNFAILMNPYNTKNVDSKVLDYITLVGCSISMVCLIVTIVMHAALWRYLKSDRANILINLSIALILSYATFIFGADKTENKVVCTTVAVALHYIYLVVFFLMLSEGIEILITVVYVFVMKSRLRWLLLMSWGLPAIIVGISVAVTQSDGYGSEDYCWLSVHSGLIWAFVGPALAILIANFVQLCIVIKAMFKVRTLKERSRIEKVKTGVRCLCVLLPLTGGTWVIGVFYVNESWAWIQYTFAILNGLQGVFIMLFHCITNSQIKIAISRRMKLYRASTSYSKSSNKMMSIPRPSTTTSHRHEHSTESYNDSWDLIEGSYQSSDRHNRQWEEDWRGHTTSYL